MGVKLRFYCILKSNIKACSNYTSQHTEYLILAAERHVNLDSQLLKDIKILTINLDVLAIHVHLFYIYLM